VAQPQDGGIDAAAKDVQDILHARLTVGPEATEVVPTDHDGAGTEGDRLDGVAAATRCTVQEHLDLAPDRLGDRG
jgi:hypothetical protein